MNPKLLFFPTFIFQLSTFNCVIHGQTPVYDASNHTTSILNHAENLSKWTESINKATQQINQLNQVISNLNNVEGLIGKGMEQVGIDPSILESIKLAKAVNSFGQAIEETQHRSDNVSFDLDRIREKLTDPKAWERYVVTSKSYAATQRAQRNYEEQIRKLDQSRSTAESQLKSAKSLGETSKAQASLESIDAAQARLDAERRRAFEQQMANYIENQNQKDAWEQAARDWTTEEWKRVGEGLDDLMKSHPALKK